MDLVFDVADTLSALLTVWLVWHHWRMAPEDRNLLHRWLTAPHRKRRERIDVS